MAGSEPHCAGITTVALCIIARNEAPRIGATLASVRDLFAEIIVVDTGSTDATREVARAHGAVAHDFPWCDDFSAARNEAIRHAKGDWVFWMDADDRLPEPSRDALRALLASLPTEGAPDGFHFQVRCTTPTTLSQEGVDHVRLFRSRGDIRFRYRVHEQIAPSILHAGGRLHATGIVIEHEGYADATVYRAKQERNLRLVELQLADTPVDPFMLYYRGATLVDLERHAEAIVPLNLASALVPTNTTLARILPNVLARAYAAEGMAEEEERTLVDARRRYPRDAATVFALALQHYEAGLIERADEELSSFLDGGGQDDRVGAGDAAIAAFRARHLRASARYLLGRHRGAASDARAVIAASPSFGDAYLVLGDALIAMDDVQGLDVLRAELASGAGGSVLVALLEAGARARLGDVNGAVARLEREMASSGEHPFLARARGRLRDVDSEVPLAAHTLAQAVVPGATDANSRQVPPDGAHAQPDHAPPWARVARTLDGVGRTERPTSSSFSSSFVVRDVPDRVLLERDGLELSVTARE